MEFKKAFKKLRVFGIKKQDIYVYSNTCFGKKWLYIINNCNFFKNMFLTNNDMYSLTLSCPLQYVKKFLSWPNGKKFLYTSWMSY